MHVESSSFSKQQASLDRLFARCEGAYSENTLRGYRNALKQFQGWCKERGLEWLPAEPHTIANFLDIEVKTKSISTIRHRVDAISFAHRMADLPSPAEHSEVRLALRRARRAKPRRPKQALGLTAELLNKIVAACPDTLGGRRHAALISVGYDTLCRSCELVAVRAEHLSDDFSHIYILRSKADPFGDGRVAYLSSANIQRVQTWLDASGIVHGPLFRGLHLGTVSHQMLGTSSIRRLIKRAAARAKLSDESVQALSGHSMRVGAAQDMMVAGVDTIGIMHAGGWKSQAVLARYVENASAEQLHHKRWQHLSSVFL
ncbi:tyrosine-type recombinase/integrase [Altererythrobacter sp. SALINAS58]|uniref:tyrosine-type recombinase/integrase n=1 Tax=Alteripontixanthobacter muriae TaxID=2705546 RepID=UPI0015767C83|nr:tyrosine-type recombinase/integrase [Alteripontixanthobacter muriae]NTZ43835.1 tyrosine-type recombinase/integrase [Alteripontixanthobacter muriae]